MKKSKHSVQVEAPRSLSARLKTWHYLLGFLLILLISFEVYGPALKGPFLFDDSYLPFLNPDVASKPLSQWLGVRPFLMTSFWVNMQLTGLKPYSYHAVNVFLHTVNGVFIFLLLRRFLKWAGAGDWQQPAFALFGACLFLLHPAQTESVAYVASRSETLSVLFFLSAFTVFVYRRTDAISFPCALLILFLFAAGVSTKEHIAVLPALLLLTDLYWNPGFSLQGIRRNWRLYVPLAAGGVVGIAYVLRVLQGSLSAGFGLKDLSWSDYLFTQMRVIWMYMRLYLFPYGLNGDYDVPVSRGLLDHGAIFGLLGLTALAIAAWVYRHKFKLASYGYFAFLVLLAPTSSFIPIKDVIVERRLYLPFIALLFITLDLLRRWRAGRVTVAAACTGILAVAAIFTHQRAEVWSSSIAFWKDTAAKSPNKSRPQFHLAYEYFQLGQCREALPHYQAVARLEKPDHRLLVNWGLAYDCALQPGKALEKFEEAARLQQTGHVHSLIGMIYAKRREFDRALRAFDAAEKVEPAYDMTYVYRAITLRGMGEPVKAVEQFRRALAINPNNQAAREGLAAAEAEVRRQG